MRLTRPDVIRQWFGPGDRGRRRGDHRTAGKTESTGLWRWDRGGEDTPAERPAAGLGEVDTTPKVEPCMTLLAVHMVWNVDAG